MAHQRKSIILNNSTHRSRTSLAPRMDHTGFYKRTLLSFYPLLQAGLGVYSLHYTFSSPLKRLDILEPFHETGDLPAFMGPLVGTSDGSYAADFMGSLLKQGLFLVGIDKFF